jgi:hypothetical protein
MDGIRRLELDGEAPVRLTHQLFRYPAKFHPPVVGKLLDLFTTPGQLVLDPFVGSGTLLIEASIRSRRSIGFDIDPVAVSVAAAKTRDYDLPEVENCCKRLLSKLAGCERSHDEYKDLMFRDISEEEYVKVVDGEGLWVPEIPNINHWFRRYVLVDLSRILAAIESISTTAEVRLLLRVVFASIIRNSSNADPVPVSGLEYTAHMRRRDEEGRLVDPYALIKSALSKARVAVENYSTARSKHLAEPIVGLADSMQLPLASLSPVDAVLTSPPYHNAVDYYRRHNLEMYWLRHVDSYSDRLALIPRYIGRPKIPAKHPLLALPWDPPPLTGLWEDRIRQADPQRANDFRHYVQAMTRTFSELARAVRPGVPAIIVVGHSSWNDSKIPTRDLFSELAADFKLEDTLYYPVKNRYMSYSRRNSASIDSEYVLILRR